MLAVAGSITAMFPFVNNITSIHKHYDADGRQGLRAQYRLDFVSGCLIARSLPYDRSPSKPRTPGGHVKGLP